MSKVVETQSVEKEVVVDRTCDRCGKSCMKGSDALWHQPEYGHFRASWGYMSNNKDLDSWDADLCESCCEAFRKWIEEGGGQMVVKTLRV